MELSIQKWGNSAAVRLPTGLLRQLNVSLGDELTVEIRVDGLLLKPKRPRYSLTELIGQCDQMAPMPVDMQATGRAKPVGNEVW